MMLRGYPDPDLRDIVVRLRRWSEDDVECIRDASTDPDIPKGTSVPAVFTEEGGRSFVRRHSRRSNSVCER